MKGGSASLSGNVVGAGYSLLSWLGNGAVAAAPGSNLTRDNMPFLNGAVLRARPEEFYVVPFAGTLSQFYVEISAAFGAGVGVNYVIYVNEVATALVVNIAGAAQTANSDLVNSVAVVAGDRVYCHCDRSAGVPGAITHGATLRLAAA